jgi:hypothetical protein
VVLRETPLFVVQPALVLEPPSMKSKATFGSRYHAVQIFDVDAPLLSRLGPAARRPFSTLASLSRAAKFICTARGSLPADASSRALD